MATDELVEAHMGPSPTNEIHRVADAAPATVREGLSMDRARNGELQEQAANVIGQSLGGCRVVDRQRLAMNAAIPLEQLSDEDRDGISIPTVDDHRDPLVDSDLSLETTVSEEKIDGLRVHPASLGEDRVIGRAPKSHPVGQCQATDLATAARPASERSECAVLREHEVPGPHLGDRLQAAVGHLDRGVRTEAFVEPVARELLHQLPDALGLRSGGAALAAAADELLALLRHQLAVLLAHGAA